MTLLKTHLVFFKSLCNHNFCISPIDYYSTICTAQLNQLKPKDSRSHKVSFCNIIHLSKICTNVQSTYLSHAVQFLCFVNPFYRKLVSECLIKCFRLTPWTATSVSIGEMRDSASRF